MNHRNASSAPVSKCATSSKSVTRAAARAACRAFVEPLEDRRLFAANPAQVDLLVAYTAPARDAIGGTNKMLNSINRAVADLNRALANSGVNSSVRLVRAMQTSYADPGGPLREPISEAIRVGNEQNPDFADVRAARAETGADLVNVVENSVGGGGQVGNYTVSWVRWFNDDLFLHELGHAFGAGHNAALGGTPPNQASAITVNGETYSTLTAGRGIDFWSSPNVLFRGVPTGAAGQDNAGVMNGKAPSVAAALTGTVADAAGPLAGLGAVSSAAGQNSVTFEVIYYDGGGVNVDSLGNANVQVTGPNGLNTAATLVGIRPRPGEAPVPVSGATVNLGAVIAVYTVNTPGAVGNLSDYAFAVGASPVKDVANNSAAGPLLSASGDTDGTSATVNPLLPRFAGGSTGRAAELGDVSGKQVRVTDWNGSYYARSGQDPNYYRFSLSAAATVNVGVSTGDVAAAIIKDKDGNTVSGNLAAGENYYVVVTPRFFAANSPTQGRFTLTLTASGNAAGVPATGGTITGRSFDDLTNDNAAQDIEAGFADQTVTLAGTDANGAAVNLTTKTTGTFGNYTFNNVPPSNGAGYTLSISRPANRIQKGVAAPTGGLPGTAAGNTYTGITITAGATLAGYNIGYANLPPFRGISGDIWDDSGDKNGIRNVGEAPVVGATLRMTGNNVAGDPVNETATTDANGTFQFTARPSDATGYTITKVQPIGFVSGTATPGNLGGVAAANNDSITGVVLSGANGVGYNLPVVKPTVTQPPPIPQPDTTTVPAGGTVTIDILGNDAPITPVFDRSGGFADSAGSLAINGDAAIDGTNLRLANAGGQSSSVYHNAPVNVQKFTTSFTLQLTAGQNIADGLTFVIQNGKSTDRGGGGGWLGYRGIDKSVAVKFDIWQNEGEPSNNTTGLFTNGEVPIGGDKTVDLNGTGIDLHSGNPLRVDMVYNGGTLGVTLTDTVSGVSARRDYTVNIPQTVKSNTAYVGFTAGTGGAFATMNILNWTYAAATTPAPRTAAAQVAVPPGGPTLLRFEVQAEDGRSIFADCTTAPAHAKSFSFNADGTITYTPEDGFVGTDSFEYLLVDSDTGRCSDDHATVTFNVVDVDDAPTFASESSATAITTAPGRAVAIDLRAYVADDDASVDDLKYAVKKIKGDTGGKVKLLSDKHTALFTPAKGFSGQTGFTFTAADGKLKSQPFSFGVLVADSGLAIDAGDTVATAKVGKTTKIDVLKNAVSNNPAATITLASIALAPTSGTAVIEGGRLLYTPDSAAAGTRQTIVVLLQDGDGNSSPANVLVDVR